MKIKIDHPVVKDFCAKVLQRPTEISAMEVSQALFKCQRCGRCCTEMNGISAQKDDIKKMAKGLKHSYNWVKSNYIENGLIRGTRESCKGAADGRCPFYKEGCTIYKARPLVCRLFPLMNFENGKLKPHWYDDCPGTMELVHKIYDYKKNHDLPEYSREEIAAINALRIMAHLRIMQEMGQIRRYGPIKDLWPKWDAQQGIEAVGIDFLARCIAIENLEMFLEGKE